MLRICIAFLLTSVLSMPLSAQDKVIEDRVYDDLFKSVQILINGQPTILPIIGLNRGSLTLSFDEMVEDASELYYKVVHCDRNWRPSDLEEIEYIEGFNGEEVRDFEFSTSLYSDYINYRVQIPNEDLKLRISGNYVISIYGDDSYTEPLITKRFLVKEKRVQIRAKVVNPFDVTLHDTHHQLDVEVEPLHNDAADPMRDYSIDIITNNRWDQSVLDAKPSFTSRGRLVFDRKGALSLPAGNEYRSFDTRSLQYAGAGVSQINLNRHDTEVVLHGDINRRHYHDNDIQDFDGRYVVANQDKPNARLSSEYTDVIFGLKAENPIADKVYLVGAFNDWKRDKKSQMKYLDGKGYVIKLKLKQGVYNYMYETEDLPAIYKHDLTEGNHYLSTNFYTILAYMYDRTLGFDRLVGSSQIQSTGR